jgi:hypothetical protein
MSMTRDEARRVIAELWKKPKSEDSSKDFYIDMFVALGGLELDEPKSPQMKLRETMNNAGFVDAYCTDVLAHIHNAGLKLVDK